MKTRRAVEGGDESAGGERGGDGGDDGEASVSVDDTGAGSGGGIESPDLRGVVKLLHEMANVKTPARVSGAESSLAKANLEGWAEVATTAGVESDFYIIVEERWAEVLAACNGHGGLAKRWMRRQLPEAVRALAREAQKERMRLAAREAPDRRRMEDAATECGVNVGAAQIMPMEILCLMADLLECGAVGSSRERQDRAVDRLVTLRRSKGTSFRAHLTAARGVLRECRQAGVLVHGSHMESVLLSFGGSASQNNVIRGELSRQRVSWTKHGIVPVEVSDAVFDCLKTMEAVFDVQRTAANMSSQATAAEREDEEAGAGSTKETRDDVCNWWAFRGGCRYGDSCRFKHSGKPEIKHCKDGGQCSNRRCPYTHPYRGRKVRTHDARAPMHEDSPAVDTGAKLTFASAAWLDRMAGTRWVRRPGVALEVDIAHSTLVTRWVTDVELLLASGRGLPVCMHVVDEMPGHLPQCILGNPDLVRLGACVDYNRREVRVQGEVLGELVEREDGHRGVRVRARAASGGTAAMWCLKTVVRVGGRVVENAQEWSGGDGGCDDEGEGSEEIDEATAPDANGTAGETDEWAGDDGDEEESDEAGWGVDDTIWAKSVHRRYGHAPIDYVVRAMGDAGELSDDRLTALQWVYSKCRRCVEERSMHHARLPTAMATPSINQTVEIDVLYVQRIPFLKMLEKTSNTLFVRRRNGETSEAAIEAFETGYPLGSPRVIKLDAGSNLAGDLCRVWAEEDLGCEYIVGAARDPIFIGENEAAGGHCKSAARHVLADPSFDAFARAVARGGREDGEDGSDYGDDDGGSEPDARAVEMAVARGARFRNSRATRGGRAAFRWLCGPTYVSALSEVMDLTDSDDKWSERARMKYLWTANEAAQRTGSGVLSVGQHRRHWTKYGWAM